MARGRRHRAMPSTPGVPRAQSGAEPDTPSPDSDPSGTPGTAQPVAREPGYLLRGTGCVGGHAPDRELESGSLGRVPSKRLARLGFGLVLWCAIGGALLVGGPTWAGIALQAMVVWLALSAVVQRRAGHRGRCWRTRAWRHAWGGLVPSIQSSGRRRSA